MASSRIHKLQNELNKRIMCKGLRKFGELQSRPVWVNRWGKVYVIVGAADHLCLIGPSVLSSQAFKNDADEHQIALPIR